MSLIKLKNNALDNLTSFEGSASLGDMVFISSATASSSASIEFSLGSYKEYKFFFVNIQPVSDGANFQFQCSTDGGSTYATTVTSTHFRARLYENDTGSDLAYLTAYDAAQSTSYLTILREIGNVGTECGSGYLNLFNPSSTTYVKHFLSTSNVRLGNVQTNNNFIAGYFNDINDLTNISFKFDTGNISSGKILMFGLN